MFQNNQLEEDKSTQLPRDSDHTFRYLIMCKCNDNLRTEDVSAAHSYEHYSGSSGSKA